MAEGERNAVKFSQVKWPTYKLMRDVRSLFRELISDQAISRIKEGGLGASPIESGEWFSTADVAMCILEQRTQRLPGKNLGLYCTLRSRLITPANISPTSSSNFWTKPLDILINNLAFLISEEHCASLTKANSPRIRILCSYFSESRKGTISGTTPSSTDGSLLLIQM